MQRESVTVLASTRRMSQWNNGFVTVGSCASFGRGRKSVNFLERSRATIQCVLARDTSHTGIVEELCLEDLGERQT